MFQLSRRPLETSPVLRSATSHRSSSAHRPGRSRRACSSGAGGGGSAWRGSTSGRSSRSQRSSSAQQRTRGQQPHRSLRRPGRSKRACSNGAGGGNASRGSTSGHSSRWRRSSSARQRTTGQPRRSTRVRAHNTKAHNNHCRQKCARAHSRRSGRTGRQRAEPAARYGISWTELLNRYLRVSNSSFADQANCLWRIVLRKSGRLCSDSLTLSRRESLADGYRRRDPSVLVRHRISPNVPGRREPKRRICRFCSKRFPAKRKKSLAKTGKTAWSDATEEMEFPAWPCRTIVDSGQLT